MQSRAHIIYSGTVQGVGFRFTAEEVANSLGLKGWVKNRPDGTVEVVIEGEKADIDAFMNKVKKIMSRYIRSAMVSWDEATGEFDFFSMKLYRG